MKKITSLIIAFAMILTMLTVPMQVGAEVTTFANGAGTPADPYLITNADELKLVSTKVNSDTIFASASYKLMADIDLANAEWTPIGKKGAEFKGIFDGNGHKVSNVKITLADNAAAMMDYLGFFGKVAGVGENNAATTVAVISNLAIENVSITYYNHDVSGVRVQNAGALAGYVDSYVEISGCSVENAEIKNTNKLVNDTSLGSMIGYVHNFSTVENCYVRKAVIAAGATAAIQGGFVGLCSNAAIFRNCYAADISDGTAASSDVSTTYSFGKNTNRYDVSATNCYSTLVPCRGTNASAKEYYDVSNKGTGEYEVGICVTKEELVDKMLATGAYELKTGENDGYPVLISNIVAEAAAFAGGTGTEADPYIIRTAGQLLKATNLVNTGGGHASFFKLDADIDFKNNEWIPMGYDVPYKKDITGAVVSATTSEFTGGFDGNNHVVKNLKITNNAGNEFHYKNIGFFGYTFGAKIKNLGIENMNIQVYNGDPTGTSIGRIAYMGGVVAYAQNSDIDNCYIKNSKVRSVRREAGNGLVGGFMGRMTGGTVDNCYAYNIGLINIHNQYYAGFAAQVDNGAKLTNCYATGYYDTSSPAQHVSGSWNATSSAYGFAYDNDSKNTYVNCLSAIATAQGEILGTSGPSSVYTIINDKDAATVSTAVKNGQTNDQIKAAFNITGFQQNAAINGGMPSLSTEKVVVVSTHTPNDYVITSVTRGIGAANADNVSVKVRNNTSVAAKVYIAAYDANNVLINACIGDAAANAETTLADKDISFTSAKYIKVYVWDSSLAPKANIYEGNRAEYNLLEPV